MRPNLRFIALYVFSMIIVYLAGVYFGSFLHVLFVFFCIYPVFSVASLLVWNFSIDVKETFNTTHPVKGEDVVYELTLSNVGFLPITNVHLVFETASPSLELMLPEIDVYLPTRRLIHKTYTINCPYRGEYKVGLSEYHLFDPLRLFSVRRKADPHTFTVYPRILQLDQFAPVATEIEGMGRYTSAGILPDTSMFQQLKEYRDGDSLRHIYWKKYASTGKPYLKEYDRTKRSGVRIYFDLRKLKLHGVNELEQEDVSVESLVALVKFFLDRRIHTTVIGPSRRPYHFAASDGSAFNSFYLSTSQLHFHEAPEPTSIYHADMRIGQLESQTVIFMTHQPDPQLFSIGSSGSGSAPIIILNTASYPEKHLGKLENLVESARLSGVDVITVSSADRICEELGDLQYAIVG